MDAAGARALRDRLSAAGSSLPLRARVVAQPERADGAVLPVYLWLSANEPAEGDGHGPAAGGADHRRAS